MALPYYPEALKSQDFQSQDFRQWRSATRRRLEDGEIRGGFAGEGRRYPITDRADVRRAWNLAGHSKTEDPDEIRRRVIAIAVRFGWQDGLPETAKSWAEERGITLGEPQPKKPLWSKNISQAAHSTHSAHSSNPMNPLSTTLNGKSSFAVAPEADQAINQAIDAKVQTVLLPTNKFNKLEAQKWLKDNGFEVSTVEAVGEYYRATQFEIKDVGTKKAFRTISLGKKGIKAVIEMEINLSEEEESEDFAELANTGSNTDFAMSGLIHQVIPWNGLELGLEHKPGEVRHPGRRWSKKLSSCYGHVRNHWAADKKALDFYGHPGLFDEQSYGKPANKMHLIEQLNPETGELDELKLMVGWDLNGAVDAYLSEMPEEFFGSIRPTNLEELDRYRKGGVTVIEPEKAEPENKPEIEPELEELDPDAELEEFLAEYAIPEKYAELDFVPPKAVQDNARAALEERAKKPASQRGGTPVGLARARDLSQGKQLSPETVRRMKAYFDRHQGDKNGADWGNWSKGQQAWGFWGGDEAWQWSQALVERMNEIDQKVNLAESDFAEDDGRGMMVGMWLPAEISQALAIPGFESADRLHLTLSYHGKFPSLPTGFKTLLTGLQNWAKTQPPLPIKIGGYGVFLPSPGSDNKQVLYASVDCPGLIELRNALTNLTNTLGFPVASDHGFNAHITLAYLPPGVTLIPTIPENLSFSLDRITLAFGGRQEHIALGSGELITPAAYADREQAEHEEEFAQAQSNSQAQPNQKYLPPSAAVDLAKEALWMLDEQQTADFLSEAEAQDYLIALHQGDGLSERQISDLCRWFEDQMNGTSSGDLVSLSELSEDEQQVYNLRGGEIAYQWAKLMRDRLVELKQAGATTHAATHAAKDAPTTKIKVGSEVQWRYGKGKGQGKVKEFYQQPKTLRLQGAEITRNGTPENPAVLIVQPNGSQILKLLDELLVVGDDDRLGYELSESQSTAPSGRDLIDRLNAVQSFDELRSDPDLRQVLKAALNVLLSDE